MPIALVRIDDRLVHGQVVEAWIPHLRARRVLVLSDQAAADPTQRALMRLALPEGVELDLLPIQEGVLAALAAEADPRRALVVLPGPAEALALARAGLPLRSVNVGGLHYGAGRIQLGRVIFLGEEDMAALRELAAMGVALEGQAVPSEPKKDLRELVGAGKRP